MKRLVTFLLALAFTFALTTAPAIAATKPNPDFFGMHHHAISQYFPDTTAIGSVRLWDDGTAWKDVEVQPGVYNWSALDAAVSNTRAHGASPFLVLGGTPTFYAADPTYQTAYGAGFCQPADLNAWSRYVTAVVTRYKGLITAYEPINEGDITMFYCGTMEHLAARSKIVFDIVQRLDPAAVVTTPSFVDRSVASQWFIMKYLTKYNGAKYAEAISYHPYGMPYYGPEQNAHLVKALYTNTHKVNIHLPVWSTEINYGLPIGGGGVVSGEWSDWMQAAYMSRTFLTQHNAGAKRVYWYAWSSASFLGVKMLEVNTNTPSPAVLAMETTKQWMRAPIDPCTINSRGTWTCRIRFAGPDGFVRWNTKGTVYEKVPAGTLTKRNMFGTLVPTTRRVGIAPVLYR